MALDKSCNYGTLASPVSYILVQNGQLSWLIINPQQIRLSSLDSNILRNNELRVWQLVSLLSSLMMSTIDDQLPIYSCRTGNIHVLPVFILLYLQPCGILGHISVAKKFRELDPGSIYISSLLLQQSLQPSYDNPDSTYLHFIASSSNVFEFLFSLYEPRTSILEFDSHEKTS